MSIIGSETIGTAILILLGAACGSVEESMTAGADGSSLASIVLFSPGVGGGAALDVAGTCSRCVQWGQLIFVPPWLAGASSAAIAYK